MKKILLIVVALLFNSNIFAYDGRGNESCSDLRESINTIKEKIRNKRSSFKYKRERCREDKIRKEDNLAFIENPSNDEKKRKQVALLMTLSSFLDSSCIEADSMEDYIEEAEHELADARDNYNMNGCTTGGKTNYNHNY